MKSKLPVLDPLLGPSVAPGLCALGVMTKAPRAGQVKTRLVPPLTPAEAAGLNLAFLKDTAMNLAAVCKRVRASGVAVYTPVGEEKVYDQILPPGFSLLSQHGNDFGERLFNASEDLKKSGFQSLCLIDSDSPTLPTDYLMRAVSSLSQEGDRIVLGPCEDGGYYLIGLNSAHRTVFDKIEWSTSRVLEQTIRQAERAGLEIEILPTWYDVDDESGLLRLCAELFGEEIDPRRYFARHTEMFLNELIENRGDDLWAPGSGLARSGV
jgi:uncharacterized protein